MSGLGDEFAAALTYHGIKKDLREEYESRANKPLCTTADLGALEMLGLGKGAVNTLLKKNAIDLPVHTKKKLLKLYQLQKHVQDAGQEANAMLTVQCLRDLNFSAGRVAIDARK